MAQSMTTSERARVGHLVSIRQILFPTDCSPESARAFDHVRFFAETFQASVTVYHAVEMPDARYAHWAFAYDNEIWARVEQEARHALERQAASLPVSHRVIVAREPSAAHGLLDLIRNEQPDLTVMATHGREGLSRVLLGSVAAAVIQHSFRPVLCVREPDHGGALPYRRILVPTDLSPGARLAFPMAALLARTFGSELIAVHVLPSGGEGPRPTEADVWKSLEADFEGLPLTAQVHSGSVWRTIVETARIEKADLVVMSTRGHDSLGDRILGSNTERVVRHAPCPVLAG